MTARAAPTVSLIIATVAETPHLPRLARSLAAQTSADFEVIVVNQGAPSALDAFQSIVSERVKLRVVNAERGLSRARNIGLAQAQGEIVAFPDDDAWYPETLIEDVVFHFQSDRDLGLLTCATRDEHNQLSNGTFLSERAKIVAENVWKAGNSNGIFVRTVLAKAVGGFDETLGVGANTPFGSGEETDFLLRLLGAGCKGQFDPNLTVHHDQVDLVADRKTIERARLYSAGYGRVLRLHNYSLSFALYRAARSIAAAILAGLRGRAGEARRRLVWASGILRGYTVSVPGADEGKA